MELSQEGRSNLPKESLEEGNKKTNALEVEKQEELVKFIEKIEALKEMEALDFLREEYEEHEKFLSDAKFLGETNRKRFLGIANEKLDLYKNDRDAYFITNVLEKEGIEQNTPEYNEKEEEMRNQIDKIIIGDGFSEETKQEFRKKIKDRAKEEEMSEIEKFIQEVKRLQKLEGLQSLIGKKEELNKLKNGSTEEREEAYKEYIDSKSAYMDDFFEERKSALGLLNKKEKNHFLIILCKILHDSDCGWDKRISREEWEKFESQIKENKKNNF